ncbi:hypothetical protein SPF06_09795 [Sinomonas sp. JGH33]|uniref:Anti sigma-E protein RseA N-terminal domain-containing protein n=1 Tax=Sinomonas terricola TaxID=3110330 RepID=A0ABU5T5Q8_9MICC|nr:hypothetical protein [Sinomonas sp. JGH33]MEA5455011.1 hypothetical protein [Sinomonas sp. JGH33]
MSSESTRDAVASFLAEAGMAHDDALGRALESLRGLCPPEAPAPTGLLAELLAPGQGDAPRLVASTRAAHRAADEALGKLTGSADAVVVRFAPRKRHRGAMISAVVVAGVGLSASGVAAQGGIDYVTGTPRADSHAASAPASPAAAQAQPVAGEARTTAGGGTGGQPAAIEPVSFVAPALQVRTAAPSRDAAPSAGSRAAHSARHDEPHGSGHHEAEVVLAPAELALQGSAAQPTTVDANVEGIVEATLPRVDLASVDAALVRPLLTGRHAATTSQGPRTPTAKSGGKHR